MIFLCHIFGSENIWGWWCACKQRLNPFNSYRWMDMVSIINSQGVSRSSVTIMNIILNMIEHDRHQDHILCIQNSYATFFPSLFFIPGIVSGSSVGDLLSNIIFFKAKHLWNHEPNNHQPNHGSHHIYITSNQWHNITSNHQWYPVRISENWATRLLLPNVRKWSANGGVLLQKIPWNPPWNPTYRF